MKKTYRIKLSTESLHGQLVTDIFTESSRAIFKGGQDQNSLVESRTKGTMILRYSGRFYKVIKVRSRGDNNHTFGCKDIDTKKARL